LLGYRSNFTIYDDDDSVRLLKHCLDDLRLDSKRFPPRGLQNLISSAKSKLIDVDDFGRQSGSAREGETMGDFGYDGEFSNYLDVAAQVYRRYQARLLEANALDFDDLLMRMVDLLRLFPERLEHYRDLFRHILVDEYQDTNRAQYVLVQLLAQEHRQVTVVGDDDQSVYSWRGADIRNILRFEDDFPDAKVVKLEQNYRSTQVILDAATAVVSNNQHRKGKVLWTDQSKGEPISLFAANDSREEAAFVSHSIKRHLQEGYSGLAILYRTNFQSRLFEEALRHLAIPYKLVGSVSFYNRQEVKDALAYLRLVRNPDDDVSLTRVLNVPARGIGNVTRNKLLQMTVEDGCSMWDALQSSLEQGVFGSRAHSCLVTFKQLVVQCRTYLDLPLQVLLDKILRESGYLSSLEKDDSEQSRNRILNLNELLNLAREYAETPDSATQFLDHVALRSEVDDYDETASVTLMTLHNAKGLEFPVVFLTGCEEGLFPHSRSIHENDLEEERRLCYVGLTRAQKKLYVTYSLSRRFFGRDSEERNRPSRFLEEIPKQLVQNTRSSDMPYPSKPLFLQGNSLSAPDRKRPYRGTTYNSADSVRMFLNNRSPAKRSKKLYSGAIVAHEKYGKGKILN
ncbi:MAG: ATP-dependent helicase, partial [bacterium]